MAALRKAFDVMVADPAFVAAASEQNATIDKWDKISKSLEQRRFRGNVVGGARSLIVR